MSPMSPARKASWLDQARQDWDNRARQDARYYICTDVAPGEEAFYASGHHDYDHHVRPFLQRRGLQPAGKVALEIGCGIGRMTRCFAEEFARVIGVDISAEMIERARGAGLARAEFILCNGRNLAGIADQSVDFVFSFIVFPHIPEKDVILNYLAETGRVLKPGGFFLLHLNGLPHMRLFGALWEIYISLSPRLRKFRLKKLPFVRRRTLGTWLGHPVMLRDIRPVCNNCGLRLLEVRGRWTQNLWVGGVKCATEPSEVHRP